MHPAALNLLSATSWLDQLGLAAVLVILFAETGLLVGFFLPGDSLLFTAGFTAAKGGLVVSGHRIHLPLGWLLVLAWIGAVAGAQTGYLIGRRIGTPLFARPDSRFFRRRYVTRTEEYFERFGPGKAVVIARFVPIVRTFLNPLAGVVGMPARDFGTWNVIGGTAWVVSVTLAGFYLHHVRVIRQHLELLILAIVVVSVIPIIVEAARQRRRGSAPAG